MYCVRIVGLHGLNGGNMDRPGHDNFTNFFVGTEVEYSPSHGQRTLFVVGIQQVEEILRRALNSKCPHIYLGANHSFFLDDGNNHGTKWEEMIKALLDQKISVTLEVEVPYVEWIVNVGLTDYTNFTAMISVRIPHVEKLNYNTTIKIDDVDFEATNPGVWCHSLHNLMDRDKFTSWSKYASDEVIE